MTERQPPGISAELVSEISAQLRDNKPVRRKLHHGGRLHIDRQLPFLCVHRHPVGGTDQGTDTLLLGQASYLKTSAEPTLQKDVSELVYQIVRTQSAAFGSFLLIELWAGGGDADSRNVPVQPTFHLMSPNSNTPDTTLETFENALLGIQLRGRQASVRVSYHDYCAPPDLPPLLTAEQAKQLECVTLGLEVKPVYRDPESGALLPYALRRIRHEITLALKSACYRFSHSNTRYRPAHFHELGRHAMTEAVFEVDQKFAELSENFDLLLHVTPVNTGEAWQAFKQSGYQVTPEFHYRPRSVDPALIKRELYKVPLEQIEDPTLADLFDVKREELDRQLTLLHDRNTPRFLQGSIQLFGQIDEALLASANHILTQPPKPLPTDELLNPEEFAQHARQEIDYYRQTDPSLVTRVEIRNDITGIFVSHGNFLIGSDAFVSQKRLSATLAHEIGTHALTYHNGKKQSLKQLYVGTAGYEELQEGLAVLAEYLCAGLGLPRLRTLSGRVIAVHSIIEGASFIDTFQLLHQQHGFKPYTAFNITMRVYRGGGYTKDMIYLHGLIRLLTYVAQHNDMEILYCGKFAMEHLPLLHELRWRKVLRPLALKPRHLRESAALQRLHGLRAEPTLAHILLNL